MQVPGPQVFTNAVSPQLAAQYPEYALHLIINDGDKIPKELAKCTRIRTLTIKSAALAELPTAVLGMTTLRRISISNAKKLKTLPAKFFSLPHVTHLHLDGCGITNLDGIEAMPSLRFLSLSGTPLGGNAKNRDALRKRFPKTSTSGITGPSEIVIPRDIAEPPKDKAKLIEAIRSDALDTRASLNKVDLSGASFERIYLFVDEIMKANLSKSKWTRCEIEGDFEGSNLEGAIFEDCTLPARMDGVNAKNAVFNRCFFSMTSMTKANLTGAKLHALQPGSMLDFEKAEAKGLSLSALVNKPEDASSFMAEKANLEDATLSFALAPEGEKGQWPQKDKFKGAKKNARTRIDYGGAAADTQPKKKAAGGLQPIGRLDAVNAALWFLAIDAADAAGWKGNDGEDEDEPKPKSDFARAMAAVDANKSELKVGKATGVLCEVSDRGYSHIWPIEGGVALLDHQAKKTKLDDDTLAGALGTRVVELKTHGKPIHLGTVVVKSGAMALLLPYMSGKLTKAELKEGAKTFVESEEGRVLVPLPNGKYDVFTDLLGKKPYEDDLGKFISRVRIVRSSTRA